MIDGEMSFCDFIWKNNPSVIKIEHLRNLNEDIIPYSKTALQDTGKRKRVISGSGEFYGEDRFEQFNNLHKLFEQGTSGMLSLPHLEPVWAKIYSLEITKDAVENILSYKFVFWEDYVSKTDYSDKFVTVNGECLWDIANRLNINIEKLIEFNIFVKRPDVKLYNREVRIV